MSRERRKKRQTKTTVRTRIAEMKVQKAKGNSFSQVMHRDLKHRYNQKTTPGKEEKKVEGKRKGIKMNKNYSRFKLNKKRGGQEVRGFWRAER